jgi:hypothetical protein
MARCAIREPLQTSGAPCLEIEYFLIIFYDWFMACCAIFKPFEHQEPQVLCQLFWIILNYLWMPRWAIREPLHTRGAPYITLVVLKYYYYYHYVLMACSATCEPLNTWGVPYTIVNYDHYFWSFINNSLRHMLALTYIRNPIIVILEKKTLKGGITVLKGDLWF